MSRKTITIDEATFERLDGLRREEESWTELAERAADVLEAETDGLDGEHTPNTLTEDHINDIASETASRVVRDLETALR